jgi:hypothetical protein
MSKRAERSWKVGLACASCAVSAFAVCVCLTVATPLPQVYVRRVDADGVSAMEPGAYARRFMSMVQNTFSEC